MSGISPANNISTETILTDDGVRLYCEIWGSGEATLIIPNGLCLDDDFRRFAAGRRVIVYDLRNRGRSEAVTDEAKLERGILNDSDDLDTVRRHFGAERVDLLGHSYVGLLVVLYAMRHPRHVNRIVQIGAMQPRADAQYPAHLTAADGVVEDVFRKMAELRGRISPQDDPVEVCKKYWELMRVMYVTNPEDASRLTWMRCELANERNFMPYFTSKVLPSIQALRFSAEDFAKVTAPVLTIHGTKDRSVPYGGARDWAMSLPNARLLAVAGAAHAPWISEPELVFGGIQDFFEGRWPAAAESVSSL